METSARCACIALALLCACAERAPGAAMRAPIYPYWTLASLPAGPPSAEKAPPPTASAVLVAKGYLLTSTYGMGAVADDFGMDPAVYVYDGSEWHAGRYVDRDKGLHLALIRADVPGTPVTLARGTRAPARLHGLLPFATPTSRDDPVPRRDCDRLPAWALEDLDMQAKPTLCVKAAVRAMPGAVFLDADGGIVGLQANPLGVSESSGPSADEIRAFLDLYFATWGAAVKPKPAY